jgi:molybdopterin-guanine dinucleotide biosynthesis protein B
MVEGLSVTLVICVVGRGRLRGKTRLIETLIERFAVEGFRVATVKHIHGAFDTAQKDTWRHLEAGAVVAVASTPTEVIAIRRRKTSVLEEALEAILVDTDLVLVEGYKKSPYPKILCADTASDALAAVKDIQNVVMISGSIASKVKEKEMFRAEFPEIRVYELEEVISAVKEMMTQEILRSLPGLDCGHCGHAECLGLVKDILRGEATREDCVVLSTNLATLKVDGEVIPLGKFPQQILRSVTLGVLNTLKGVGKHPKTVELTIKTEQK